MKDDIEHSRLVDPPTPREKELIALIARGLPNKAIAYEMKISPHTVRAHIGNIMRKYRLRNRTQIAMTLTARAWNAGPSREEPRSMHARRLGWMISKPRACSA